MKLNKHINLLACLALLLTGMMLTSCEDEPDKFELTDGTPTINYVRVGSFDSRDSLITEASMKQTICLVGHNLTSIKEMYFNDQKAILNTSYITDHTLLVDVPGGIPQTVSDKIFMVNQAGDTTSYSFHVIVPAPTVTRMSYQYAPAGSEVTLSGDYFIDDPNVPLTVTIGENNVPVTDIKSITKTTLTFTIPEGVEEGPVTVTSIYGKTTSKFHYLESRGIVFDFDGLTGLTNHGWHARTITTDETAVTGNFVIFGEGATMTAEGGWDDGAFSFEYWPGDYTDPVTYTDGVSARLNDVVSFANFPNMSIQFDMFIPTTNPWQAGAMQIICAGTDKITNSGGGTDQYGNTVAGANNTFFNNDVLPRAVYMPWQSTGSYDTGDQWQTVTIPLSAFAYGMAGGKATGAALTAADFASLTIFITGGGVTGKECQPIIKIDNIRFVPYTE